MIFALIMAFLDFLLSIWGVVALLSGMILFIALPVIPAVTGEFQKFARFHLFLATKLVGRAAIVLSEHGDLLYKRMKFDDLGVEKISFDSQSKDFKDPAGALHYFMGIPFALADEVHGVLFDPRHSALGMRKRDADERGEFSFPATSDEWKEYGVHEWKRGVFEMPRVHELVDLGAVRKLIDGGERAEYGHRVEEMYKHSRAPFQSGTSAARLIMIIAALLAPFGMCWLIASQGSNVSAGGSTVGYGSSFLLFAAAVKDLRSMLREVDWKFIGKLLAVALPLPTIFLLVFVFVNPLVAIVAFIVLGMGFWLLPILGFLLRPSAKLGGGLARLLLKTGLMGYSRPVLEWTPSSYRLREHADVEHDGQVKWYGLAGSLIGFTYPPTPDSWGAEYEPAGQLEARAELVTDGGTGPRTNIPAGYARAPEMSRADVYAAFLPSRTREDKYYLNTGIAAGRFTDSAVGEVALSRLMLAKEVHGGDNSASDRSIMMMMLISGVVSLALGVFVFFL